MWLAVPGLLALLPITGTPSAAAAPGDGWYDLTAYQSVVWNNGFDPMDPIRIGKNSYPSSIVGYYGSSSSDQMNKAVWVIGGQCDRFAVTIGKDADSPSSAGVGRFAVLTDDVEVFSAEKTMSDPPQDVEVDITDKMRLTLFDTKKTQDARNAWGRPRVHCTAPPGEPR